MPAFRMLSDYLFIITISLYLQSTIFFLLVFPFNVLPLCIFTFFMYCFSYRFIPFLIHFEFYSFIFSSLGLLCSNKIIFFIYPLNLVFCAYAVLSNIISYKFKCSFLSHYFDSFSKSLSVVDCIKQAFNHSSFLFI